MRTARPRTATPRRKELAEILADKPAGGGNLQRAIAVAQSEWSRIEA
jgi:hypothetical protein